LTSREGREATLLRPVPLGDITTAPRSPVGPVLGRLANFTQQRVGGRPADSRSPWAAFVFPNGGPLRAIPASSTRRRLNESLAVSSILSVMIPSSLESGRASPPAALFAIYGFARIIVELLPWRPDRNSDFLWGRATMGMLAVGAMIHLQEQSIVVALAGANA